MVAVLLLPAGPDASNPESSHIWQPSQFQKGQPAQRKVTAPALGCARRTAALLRAPRQSFRSSNGGVRPPLMTELVLPLVMWTMTPLVT
jgi:hypothetical protein